jgi:DNA-binding beta-propeller fold protein YncE
VPRLATFSTRFQRKKRFSKRLLTTLAFLVLGLLAGCGARRDGLVVMLDHSYRAEIAAATQTGFTAPDGLRWANGKLYLADESGAAVAVLRGGQFATLADARLGLESPEDLVVDAAGNAYFTDDDAGGLWKIDADGRGALLAGRGQGLVSTEGVALAPDGSVLVGETTSHRIYRVTPAGAVSVFLEGVAKPESLAYDDDGNLYIADNKEDILYLLDKERKLHRVIQRDDNFSPESIVFARGALYVTDSKHSKLSRYTAQDGLQPVAVFGGKLQGVAGVALDDEQGDIYVTVQSDLIRKKGYLIKFNNAANP